MIKAYSNYRRHYSFIDEESVNNNENVFTTIVGKNGTGKSTLLCSLVYDLLDEKSRDLY